MPFIFGAVVSVAALLISFTINSSDAQQTLPKQAEGEVVDPLLAPGELPCLLLSPLRLAMIQQFARATAALCC